MAHQKSKTQITLKITDNQYEVLEIETLNNLNEKINVFFNRYQIKNKRTKELIIQNIKKKFLKNYSSFYNLKKSFQNNHYEPKVYSTNTINQVKSIQKPKQKVKQEKQRDPIQNFFNKRKKYTKSNPQKKQKKSSQRTIEICDAQSLMKFLNINECSNSQRGSTLQQKNQEKYKNLKQCKTNNDLFNESPDNTTKNFSSPLDLSKRKNFMFLTKLPKQSIEIIKEVDEKNQDRRKFLKLNDGMLHTPEFKSFQTFMKNIKQSNLNPEDLSEESIPKELKIHQPHYETFENLEEDSKRQIDQEEIQKIFETQLQIFQIIRFLKIKLNKNRQKIIMRERFQEFNGIIQRDNQNNQNNDQSDVEIDVRSFARLRSQNISPIIPINRKKQLVNNVFFDFDPSTHRQQGGLSYDKTINPSFKNFSRNASPIQNSRYQSFIFEGTFPLENNKKFAHQFNQLDIDKSFSQNIPPNTQNENSKNSSTIITQDNKILFNPIEMARINKNHLFQMIDIINDRNNHDYNKTYIMKKINVFSHNYNNAIKRDIPSPKSRRSKIKKNKNKNNKYINSTAKKRKSKGCNCKNSKCLHRYCECFQGKEHCGTNCVCINCKNNSDYEFIRKAAIMRKESKDPLAFLSKEQRQIMSGDKKNENKKSNKNCNCKKSGCVKKYCNCYQQGMKCGRSCKCKGCENQKRKNQVINFLSI